MKRLLADNFASDTDGVVHFENTVAFGLGISWRNSVNHSIKRTRISIAGIQLIPIQTIQRRP